MEWFCPLCQQALTKNAATWRCLNGHCFDVAKQGYVNLHPVQAKNSKTPGDNKEMIHARRRFLSAGHYDCLVQAIAAQIEAIPAEESPPSHPEAEQASQSQSQGKPKYHWLDIGCGEGFYTGRLSKIFSHINWHGIDVSKEAIKLAAGTYDSEFAVASNRQIPINHDACDGILQIFSPAFDRETARVLKSTGSLIRVTPGPEHLHEIKKALYRSGRMHSCAKAPEGFSLKASDSVHKTITLNKQQAITDLLQMTPYQWHGDRNAKNTLNQHDELQVTLHFIIERFALKPIQEETA